MRISLQGDAIAKFLKLAIFLVVCTVLAYSKSYARSWYVPQAVINQSMGYQGAFSLGLGYQPARWYGLDFIYGYSPEAISGQDINLLVIKNRFFLSLQNPASTPKLQPYLGLSLIKGFSEHLFLQLPEGYPTGYYPPTALRAALHLGIVAEISASLGFYSEFVLLDSELVPALKHSKSMQVQDFGSLALGLRWLLE